MSVVNISDFKTKRLQLDGNLLIDVKSDTNEIWSNNQSDIQSMSLLFFNSVRNNWEINSYFIFDDYINLTKLQPLFNSFISLSFYSLTNTSSSSYSDIIAFFTTLLTNLLGQSSISIVINDINFNIYFELYDESQPLLLFDTFNNPTLLKEFLTSNISSQTSDSNLISFFFHNSDINQLSYIFPISVTDINSIYPSISPLTTHSNYNSQLEDEPFTIWNIGPLYYSEANAQQQQHEVDNKAGQIIIDGITFFYSWNQPSYGITPIPTLTPTTTNTPTFTETNTPTFTETITSTSTLTPTITNTPTETITETITSTSTLTPTITNTPTETITETITSSSTLTPTITNTPTETITETPTGTETLTPTLTNTPTETITETLTATESGTPTETGTPVPLTPTGTETITGTQTPSGTMTPTNTYTGTQTPSGTMTPTGTELPTPTQTDTPTPTYTPWNGPVLQNMPSGTNTAFNLSSITQISTFYLHYVSQYYNSTTSSVKFSHNGTYAYISENQRLLKYQLTTAYDLNSRKYYKTDEYLLPSTSEVQSINDFAFINDTKGIFISPLNNTKDATELLTYNSAHDISNYNVHSNISFGSLVVKNNQNRVSTLRDFNPRSISLSSSFVIICPESSGEIFFYRRIYVEDISQYISDNPYGLHSTSLNAAIPACWAITKNDIGANGSIRGIYAIDDNNILVLIHTNSDETHLYKINFTIDISSFNSSGVPKNSFRLSVQQQKNYYIQNMGNTSTQSVTIGPIDLTSMIPNPNSVADVESKFMNIDANGHLLTIFYNNNYGSHYLIN